MQNYPNTGEVFKLTLDGSDPNVQPLAMVRNYGHNPAGWRYLGKNVVGCQTREFMLAAVGRCANWKEIKTKVLSLGKIPEGQWLTAFLAAYPEQDGTVAVGVADDSWRDEEALDNFPCIPWSGNPIFSLANHACIVSQVHWHWLVEVNRTAS